MAIQKIRVDQSIGYIEAKKIYAFARPPPCPLNYSAAVSSKPTTKSVSIQTDITWPAESSEPVMLVKPKKTKNIENASQSSTPMETQTDTTEIIIGVDASEDIDSQLSLDVTPQTPSKNPTKSSKDLPSQKLPPSKPGPKSPQGQKKGGAANKGRSKSTETKIK
jgi:hypothetical protein